MSENAAATETMGRRERRGGGKQTYLVPRIDIDESSGILAELILKETADNNRSCPSFSAAAASTAD
jgi:hypothetical protein